MITKVHKWGNSLGVRIPKSFAAEANFSDGSPVDIALINGNVVLKPVQTGRYQLQQLLSGITSSNLHREIDAGDAVGLEVW